ncbi:hypothetical protein TNCV_1548611 [Trichonephila clavipes]|nr:hypothetical protein TNCV_1548611 [Trichonephila clavipes]
MHLVPNFGALAPASFVLEGMGSIIIHLYPAKLLEFLNSDFRILFLTKSTYSKNFKILVQHPKNDHKCNFSDPRLLVKVAVTVCVIESRPEASGKVTTIFHIGYQIQIVRLKIR